MRPSLAKKILVITAQFLAQANRSTVTLNRRKKMCDICGRGSCTNWMHSIKEQERYSDVIDAFDAARELRSKVKDEIELEEQDEQE